MKENQFKENGITLVALVVTIIILLILAGVAISNLLGENGLIKQAKVGKEKYAISEAKEKIELEITNLQVEQQSKGEGLTKEILTKINNEDIDVRDTSNFPVEVICGKYKFEVDNNFQVKYIGEADGTVIKYTTEPDDYTNQSNVKVLLKISNPKGIKSIKKPGEDESEIVQNQTKIETDFSVSKNGHYIIEVIDAEDKEVKKDIYIDLIDTLAPEEFTPEIQKNENSITVIENGKDADATEESTKSGIDYYEYYIKSSNETQYKKYETKEITNLEKGSYNIYVIAYDKAGNSMKSEEITYNLRIIAKKIVNSGSSFYVIDKNGVLWARGNNNYGQLGDGTTISRNISKKILSEENVKFTKVSASEYNVLALDENGNMWTWGRNNNGLLGNGTNLDSSKPEKVIVEENIKFIDISTSNDTSLALDENGNIWTWGKNLYGQLGDETIINSIKNLPSKIVVEENIKFLSISTCGGCSLALDENGNIWACGKNYGKYGNGESNYFQPCKRFTKIENDIKFKYINSSERYTMLISQSGDVYICGDDYGEVIRKCTNCDLFADRYICQPVKINGLSNVVEIVNRRDAGGDCIIALDSNGEIWTLGKSNAGELGMGKLDVENEVFRKISVDKIKYRSIDIDYFRVSAVDENGEVWVWGNVEPFNSNTRWIGTPMKIEF